MGKWEMVRLGDVCDNASSNIAQKDLVDCDGAYPVYGASGLIKYVNFYTHKCEYVAVVKDGAGIGRTTLMPAKSSVIGTMQAIIPRKSIDSRYLYYAITAMNLAKYHTGATIPHIYFKDYKNESLCLPPLPVQKQIAHVLDLTSALIEKHKAQLDKLDLLMKSQFVKTFGSVHHNLEYKYVPLAELTKVVSGGTPSRDKKEYWNNGTIKWVKTTELQNCELFDTDEKITQDGLDNSSAKIVPPSTILIAMYGQGKTRGMTAFLTVEATTNQACACILPSDKINQRYLWHYIKLSYRKLRELAKGGNQPNLNGNMIKQFPILLPPIALQTQFADFVQQVDAQKQLLQSALEKLEQNYKSLMQKCLRGEIF